MDALIVFQDDNAHPLGGLLRRGFRHVWCATLDPDRGWTSYDWRQGVPELRIEAGPEFDLAGHYRSEGYTVLQIEAGNIPAYRPFILNNCVGHVKLVTGSRSWALTPYQLYKHFTKEHRSMRSRLKILFTVPGFGGSPKPQPVVAPPPPPKPPTKANEAVQTARTDEKKRAKLQAGQGGTIKTSLLDPVGEATTTKTLLG